MASEIKSNPLKLKPKSRDDDWSPSSSSKGKGVLLSVNKMKVDGSYKQGFDSKNKYVATVSKSENRAVAKLEVKGKTATVTTLSKSEVKGKAVSSSSKTVTKTQTVKVKVEKKVYTLPGQKHDPPEEREPSRIFYESLFRQIPTSEMAEFWMMEHGLLSPERAKKAHDKKLKRNQQQRMGTPIKSTKGTPETSKRQPPPNSKNGELSKKRSLTYDDDDDDLYLEKKRLKIQSNYR